MAEFIRPWELPLVIQQPVAPEEVRRLFENLRNARTDVAERRIHEEYREDILRLKHGTGFYKRKLREGESSGLSDDIHMGFTYFCINVGNVHILLNLDVRGVAMYIRAAETPEALSRLPLEELYMFTSAYPVPMDRLTLLSEIGQHA